MFKWRLEPIERPVLLYMSDSSALLGPERDFVGYGRSAPALRWPGSALVAINFVVVYEEGAEYSIPDGDGRNDNWGEFNLNISNSIRDLGTETHFEYGSRAGIWRLARLLDRSKIPVTVSACAMALKRNPEVVTWITERNHDILGHGLRWSEFWTMTCDEEREQLSLALKLTREI